MPRSAVLRILARVTDPGCADPARRLSRRRPSLSRTEEPSRSNGSDGRMVRQVFEVTTVAISSFRRDPFFYELNCHCSIRAPFSAKWLPITVRADRIYAFTKFAAALLGAVVFFAFCVLYFFPTRTKQLFAWPIAPPMTAMFIGASYANGVIFFASVQLLNFPQAISPPPRKSLPAQPGFLAEGLQRHTPGGKDSSLFRRRLGAIPKLRQQPSADRAHLPK